MARTVVFDFDGVIHSYTSGWQGEDTIPDPPVPGIREALKEIHDAGYEVVVVSTRCATIKGHGAIEAWLYDNGMREYIDKVCKEKLPAVAYIDDRAICFDGHPETLLKKIQNFLPWYKKPTLTPTNEWISVEERLPKVGDCYIVAIKQKYPWEKEWEINVDVASFNFDGGYIDNHWDTLVDWIEGQETHVTHWMPLPQPPSYRSTGKKNAPHDLISRSALLRGETEPEIITGSDSELAEHMEWDRWMDKIKRAPAVDKEEEP